MTVLTTLEVFLDNLFVLLNKYILLCIAVVQAFRIDICIMENIPVSDNYVRSFLVPPDQLSLFMSRCGSCPTFCSAAAIYSTASTGLITHSQHLVVNPLDVVYVSILILPCIFFHATVFS